MKKIIIRAIVPVAILASGIAGFMLLEANKPEPEKKEEAIRPLSVYVEHAEQTDVSL